MGRPAAERGFVRPPTEEVVATTTGRRRRTGHGRQWVEVRTAREREMVARLVAAEKARATARSFGCSPSTVRAARDLWLAPSEQKRSSGAWCALGGRSAERATTKVIYNVSALDPQSLSAVVAPALSEKFAKRSLGACLIAAALDQFQPVTRSLVGECRGEVEALWRSPCDTTSAFTRAYSSAPSSPLARPTPLTLTPPKGMSCRRRSDTHSSTLDLHPRPAQLITRAAYRSSTRS